MRMEEVWKVVDGTGGRYEVSNTGKVRSLNYKNSGKMREMCPAPDPKGYMKTLMLFDGKAKVVKIHRLVAMAFVPNPDGLPQVNHKDGNKANNCVDNLEWATNYDNAHHAMDHGLFANSLKAIIDSNRARARAVIAIDKQGNKQEFVSINEASRMLGVNRRHVQAILKGNKNHIHGYTFVRVKGGG